MIFMAYNNNYNDDGGENTKLVPLNDAARNSLQQIEPRLTQAMMDQFFFMSPQKDGKFKLSINKAGLYWKMDDLYRGNYDIETDLVPKEKYELIKASLGFKPEDQVIIMQSTLILHTSNGERKFKAYGTVTPENRKKNKHPLELAETRAEKRVLAKATGCGFSLANNDEGEDLSPEDELREQAKGRFWSLAKEQGYDKDRNNYLNLCTQVLGRPVTTTKTLTYADFSKVNAYMEGKNTVTINPSSYKVEDIPPQKLSPTKEQLDTMYDCFKKLEWTPDMQGKYFQHISKGKWNCEMDVAQARADGVIKALQKMIAEKEAEKAEFERTVDMINEFEGRNLIPPEENAPNEAPLFEEAA